MEGKKKFEKPEMKVVELKQAVLGPGSPVCACDGHCYGDHCGLDGFCDDDD